MCSNVKKFVFCKVNAWPNETSVDWSLVHFSVEITEIIKGNWFKVQVQQWLSPSSGLSGKELVSTRSSALPFIPFTMLAGQEGLVSSLADRLFLLPDLFSVRKVWGGQKKAEISQGKMEPIGPRAQAALAVCCPNMGLAYSEGACVISYMPAAARALGLHVSCQQFSQLSRHCRPCRQSLMPRCCELSLFLFFQMRLRLYAPAWTPPGKH